MPAAIAVFRKSRKNTKNFWSGVRYGPGAACGSNEGDATVDGAAGPAAGAELACAHPAPKTTIAHKNARTRARTIEKPAPTPPNHLQHARMGPTKAANCGNVDVYRL